MSSPIDYILEKFSDEPEDRIPQSDGSILVRCPGPNHINGDIHPSLHLSEGNDGRILMHCMANCETEDILNALNLTTRDLFPQANVNGRVVARYSYVDENNTPLYQVERLEPKSFRQRRPDPKNPNRWIYDTKGVRLVLYRLPEVLKAVGSDAQIWITEGEKDADALSKLGLCATTSARGSSGWQDVYSQSLAGARVVILPDNDPPGQKYAFKVAKSLLPVAAEVKILVLPNLPEKGDVSDWLEFGGSAAGLNILAAKAKVINSPKDISYIGRTLGTRLSDVMPEKVNWLWYGRIPYGKLTILDGDPGLGKSTLSLDLAARVSAGKEMPFDPESMREPAGVVLIGVEDGLADTVRPRIDAAGGDPSRICALGQVPDDKYGERPIVLPDDLPLLESVVEEYGAKLVIIDPVVAFLPTDTNTYQDQAVRGVLSSLSIFAENTGVAVLLIRHLNKSSLGNALYRGGGSIAFVAAVRSAMVVAKDPTDPEKRILATTKNNLSKSLSSLAFHLEPVDENVGRIVWDGKSDFSADNILSDHSKDPNKSDRDYIEEIISEIMADGPKYSNDIFEEARREGVTIKQSLKALKALGYIHSKDGMKVGHLWMYPNISNITIE